MTIYKRLSLILLCLLMLEWQLPAQEFLTGLGHNPVLSNFKADKQYRLKSQHITIDTLDLPFFDDFTSTNIIPDHSKWEDSYVFINSSYPVNPISYNVATFDAIDENGDLYEHANSTGFEADRLTSRPIDLDYPATDGIVLSFYYQPQGLGSEPNPNDSLILEFFSPVDTAWNLIWAVRGTSLHEFTQVMIPIDDEIYLQCGFQFRFRNKASLSNFSDAPGRIGNDDHWHIDFVYLDIGRDVNITVIDDVTIAGKLPTSMLLNHTAIPWSHYPNAFQTQMKSFVEVPLRNLYSAGRSAAVNFTITGVNNNYFYDLFENEEITTNIDPQTRDFYSPLNIEVFDAPGSLDSAIFMATFYLTIDTVESRQHFRWNDTIRHYQVFANYYAYDDGTAENGYGLDGQGAANAMLAYRFSPFRPDTLRAVQMYFNRSQNNANVNNFFLTVWDNDNGKPGSILYSEPAEEYKPTFKGLNHFVTYHLKTPIAVEGPFYVGWRQTNDQFLNVGFDRNTVNNDKIFYNLDGNWYNSGFEGSLMIRAVVGKPLDISINIEGHTFATLEFNIYPNPAANFIKLDVPASLTGAITGIVIHDIQGRQVFSAERFIEEIDVSNLKSGIYILSLSTSPDDVARKKIIINR